MAKILGIPIGFRLFDMANGEKYTIDDDSTVLTPELEKSDKETDEAYANRFKSQPKKGNGAKGKTAKFKENTKVNKNQLKEVKTTKKAEKSNEQKEIAD